MQSTAPTHVLITGATSGIGYELAKLFAAAGKPLILVARLEDRLAAVAAELRAAHGVEVDVVAVDLFTPEGAQEVIRRVQAAGRVVDVLVNNAGQGEWGLFVETDLQRQLDIIHLNVVVLVTLTRHFMAEMVARDDGKILHLGSVFSKIPAPYMSVYAATKAFVLSFGEALINELKDTKVTTTVLMPGATDTDFFHKAGAVHTRVYGESPLSNPTDVARDGYDALMSGKSSIVSGLRNKIQATMADLLPLTVDAAIARSVNEPITPGEHTRTEATHEASRQEREALGGGRGE